MPTSTESRSQRQTQLLTRERARVIALAIDPRTGRSPQALTALAEQLERDIDPKTIRNIHRRYLRLSTEDMSTFRQLQKDGAHASILLQFIGATQDHELDDRPTRDRICHDFQKRRAQQKAARPMEITARVLAPTLFVATCALVVPWLATKAAVATGAALTLAAPIHAVLDPIAVPLLKIVAAESGGWIARGGLAMGAWFGWRYASRVLPDLKQGMSEPETQILDGALGPGARPWRLHSALRSIPGPDRHLLAHLLPAELRAFLRGDDAQRRELLTMNPPPLLAEVKSLMATHPPGLANFWRLSRDLGDLCLPETLRKGPFLNPRLDTECRLERWRKQRPELEPERLDVDELLAVVSSRQQARMAR